jgi:hypothetical protein
MYKIFFSLLLLFACQFLFAQNPLQNITNRARSIGQQGGSGTKSDSLGLGFTHRDDLKDSISISYKYLDSIRNIQMDTNINDFYKFFDLPSTQQYLGNNGTAGYSLIFTPFNKAGWDAGFHGYDAYLYTLENSRFFKTTKPYTRIGYQLATFKEQTINILHTQNPKPNINFGLDFRLIGAPGYLTSQNANNKSYRIFGSYQGKRKRYAGYFVLLGNTIKSAENGGIVNDSNLLNKTYYPLFSINTNLSGPPNANFNPFNTTVNTGNIYKNFAFFLRQTYDLGKKDSIAVNDSTTEYLFYAKLRFQYSFAYNDYSYQYLDNLTDSTTYQNWYDLTFTNSSSHPDTLTLIDKWKIITNDFSLLQFPDTKNANQYLMAGARLENIKGTFTSGTKIYYNVVLHGEYRNKTRNRLWDILANGEFYLTGLNAGDYSATASLSRFLNKRWGNISLYFSNVNRSPSFIYNPLSSFSLGNAGDFNKENITMLSATADNPFISLAATNYLITNYIYYTNYYQTVQYSKLINLLQLSASKKFRLSKNWYWYVEATLQQTDGAAPVRVPLLFARNRISYEGLFFKNLNLSTGIEFRYYTKYRVDNYSPVMGKFFPQDTITIKNRPDVSAYLHFRIRSFTAYIRADNLNTFSFANGVGFTHYNYAAPHYIYPGFIFRFGIQWAFVN